MSFAAINRPSTSSNAPGLQRQSSSYAPTSTPTPGQPLLLGGKMLAYPNWWPGCYKCQNTGYKHGDPTHPCRKCWQSYGIPYNPLIISSSGLQGAKILQSPLALSNRPSGSHSHGYPMSGRTQAGNASYPGSTFGHQYQHYQNTGSSLQGSQSTGSHRPPPVHPAPNTASGRRSPPQVVRAEDAREDNGDEDGEAPPAYADAVAAGPDEALPPQRRDQQGRLLPPTQTGDNLSTPTTSHMTANSLNAPVSRPNSAHTIAYPPPPSHPSINHPITHTQVGMNNLSLGPAAPFHHPPPPAQIIPYGHIPPPNAIVLRPGDPRIGGRLCYKCGGQGVRDSLWWGSETCYHCGGSGRLM
ncbi:hypothetical protein CBS101457_001729 [Exobasidium rhododendri]|nr:hypothetical protein CBS101457_001729 [Exobasidium rhododendri]